MSKIKDISANYTRDLANCANTYLLVESCPGGRPIVSGYVCPHCGVDPSYGDCNGVIGFVKKQTESVNG